MSVSSALSTGRSSSARPTAAAKRVVVVGGGTGTFTVLTGLRAHEGLELAAITTMADDGGSTGRLRDEYGVLPPGDLRQCLVALSDAPQVLRELFSYRYDRGGLKGHNFGNLFLSTLEHMTGDLDRALDIAAEVLAIRGTVIPVTLQKVRLIAELGNGKVLEGEQALTNYQLVSRYGLSRIRLAPRAKANPKALAALASADLIVVGPGNFYSSIAPNFLVAGIPQALRASKAKKVFVTNLMNKDGQTDGFTAATYVETLEAIAGAGRLFDAVLCNTRQPAPALVRRYAEEGQPVSCGGTSVAGRPIVGKDLLAAGLYQPKAGDTLRRTLIRHDPAKLAAALVDLF